MHLRELPLSEELARQVLEAVPAGVVHVAADGRILSANQEALAILGFRFDELSKRWIQDFAPVTVWEDGSPCPPSDYPITKALESGEVQPPVVIGVKSPDRISWAVYRAVPLVDRDSGKVTGAIATFVDVTEQKQAQAALRASEEKWRSLAQNIPDFVAVVDRDGKIVSVNRHARGFPEGGAIGTNAVDYLHPDDCDAFRAKLDLVISTGTTALLECRAYADDRALRWFESTIVPLRAQGSIEAAVVVARDVTEHRLLLRQLAEKERLASVGMLAASVAHEINNPLTYVLANLEFALNPRRADADLRDRALRDARAGAERVQQIVRDLKILARPEREDFVFVELKNVVGAALRLAGPEVSHRAAVHLDLDHAPYVVGSESQLVQVFINLLVNAAHAIEERGGPTGHIEVSARSTLEGDLVAVDVRDDGAGIAPEILNRVFDPFFTTKASRSGTGLGLAICRDIVEQAGGRMEVVSEVDRGSTFTVWWPTSKRSTATGPRATVAAMCARLVVLVVDDDMLVADALVRAIQDQHEPHAACSGRKALREMLHRDFDVVVCDLMMPDLGGLELYDAITAQRPELARRFVFVTGGLVSAETTEAIAKRGGRLLRKPFGAAELLAAIAELSAAQTVARAMTPA